MFLNNHSQNLKIKLFRFSYNLIWSKIISILFKTEEISVEFQKVKNEFNMIVDKKSIWYVKWFI